MTVAEYMTRTCICGEPRSHHGHGWINDDVLKPPEHRDPRNLRVVGITTACDSFVDAIELELTGDPRRNKHLGPLMGEGD